MRGGAYGCRLLRPVPVLIQSSFERVNLVSWNAEVVKRFPKRAPISGRDRLPNLLSEVAASRGEGADRSLDGRVEDLIHTILSDRLVAAQPLASIGRFLLDLESQSEGAIPNGVEDVLDRGA